MAWGAGFYLAVMIGFLAPYILGDLEKTTILRKNFLINFCVIDFLLHFRRLIHLILMETHLSASYKALNKGKYCLIPALSSFSIILAQVPLAINSPAAESLDLQEKARELVSQNTLITSQKSFEHSCPCKNKIQ